MAETTPTSPEPPPGIAAATGTVGVATQILHYIDYNIIHLLVDGTWIATPPTSTGSTAPIWEAASKPDKFAIVVRYNSDKHAMWVQVRTRWDSDPRWGA